MRISSRALYLVPLLEAWLRRLCVVIRKMSSRRFWFPGWQIESQHAKSRLACGSRGSGRQARLLNHMETICSQPYLGARFDTLAWAKKVFYVPRQVPHVLTYTDSAHSLPAGRLPSERRT